MNFLSFYNVLSDINIKLLYYRVMGIPQTVIISTIFYPFSPPAFFATMGENRIDLEHVRPRERRYRKNKGQIYIQLKLLIFLRRKFVMKKLCFIFIIFVISSVGLKSNAESIFSTKTWCKDSLAICWNTSEKWMDEREYFPGVKLILEPSMTHFVQDDIDMFDEDFFKNSLSGSSLGIELGIYKDFIALQLLVMGGFSLKFTEDSDIVEKIKSEDKKVRVNYGVAAGFSFFYSWFAVGVGYLKLNRKDIENPTGGDDKETYTYLKVQPISMLKSGLRQLKGKS